MNKPYDSRRVSRHHKAARRDIEKLAIAALNLLDHATLTPWQRARAEQIYELAGELEDGEPLEDSNNACYEVWREERTDD